MQSNGKRLAISVTIVAFIVGLSMGVMSSLLQAQSAYVSKDDYREDIARLERQHESINSQLRELRRDFAKKVTGP